MATDNNIKHFTAADIEKYHKGLLSGKERHDLEKAALDDPFLADALEGYAVPGVNASADIAELKKRLTEKTEEAKVIPINKNRRAAFPLLRAAAIIVVVAGAGLLVYQFAFNNKSAENSIAKNEPLRKEEVRAADSSSAVANAPVSETTAQKIATPAKPVETKDKETVATLSSNEGSGGNATVQNNAVGDVTPGTVTASPVATEAPKGVANNSGFLKVEEKTTDKKDLTKEEMKRKALNPEKQEADKAVMRDEAAGQEEQFMKKSNAVTANRKAADQYRNTANTFRGRVTDASNVGVPFANVTNTEDNVGTYTDSKGYFNLTSPDTLLNVQVRSIGFENNTVQLRNQLANNQVVLQDDRKSLSEVVISNQKPNAAARSRDGNMKLEEPEPADGWDNYDTYLTNNLNVPEEYKSKPTNKTTVEVSFEVDKNGDPVNIKIEKSLCDKCNKEAIRLIKEGPKWKRNAKKGRTTVTIPFNNSLQ